jgi:hypothetical protein
MCAGSSKNRVASTRMPWSVDLFDVAGEGHQPRLEIGPRHVFRRVIPADLDVSLVGSIDHRAPAVLVQLRRVRHHVPLDVSAASGWMPRRVPLSTKAFRRTVTRSHHQAILCPCCASGGQRTGLPHIDEANANHSEEFLNNRRKQPTRYLEHCGSANDADGRCRPASPFGPAARMGIPRRQTTRSRHALRQHRRWLGAGGSATQRPHQSRLRGTRDTVPEPCASGDF